jgi:hypothetical protein
MLLLWLLALVCASSATRSSPPPAPSPPEPSPPPPPPPLPPEPASNSDEVVVLHFLDGDETAVMRRSGVQGPSLLLHMLVSSLSALAMLVLTCSLRHQALQRVRVRPSVAIARPVLQVYGMLPGSESRAATAELAGVVDGSETVEQTTNLLPATEAHANNTRQVETIQVELIRQPADWTSCVAVPLDPGVAVGQRVEGSPPVEAPPGPAPAQAAGPQGPVQVGTPGGTRREG